MNVASYPGRPRAVDPLPEKIKREEGLVKLITRLTDVTGRKGLNCCMGTDWTTPTEAYIAAHLELLREAMNKISTL